MDLRQAAIDLVKTNRRVLNRLNQFEFLVEQRKALAKTTQDIIEYHQLTAKDLEIIH